MIWYACAFGTINFLLLLAHTIRKERANKSILAHLRRSETREQQMWEILTVIKEYRESGRIQHKEAAVAKDEIGKKVEAAAGELAQRIEKVPEKVAEAIKGDSGIHRA